MTGLNLSECDSNASRPRIWFPAALFPEPDRPTITRRSSGEDGDKEEDEGEKEDDHEGEVAMVCEEEKEEKTGE